MNTTTQSNEKTAPAVDLPVDLRDYFAAKAIPVATKWEEDSPTYGDGNAPTFRGIAERAYLMADAMLKARNQ